jgi:hypothetical protein
MQGGERGAGWGVRHLHAACASRPRLSHRDSCRLAEAPHHRAEPPWPHACSLRPAQRPAASCAPAPTAWIFSNSALRSPSSRQRAWLADSSSTCRTRESTSQRSWPSHCSLGRGSPPAPLHVLLPWLAAPGSSLSQPPAAAACLLPGPAAAAVPLASAHPDASASIAGGGQLPLLSDPPVQPPRAKAPLTWGASCATGGATRVETDRPRDDDRERAGGAARGRSVNAAVYRCRRWLWRGQLRVRSLRIFQAKFRSRRHGAETSDGAAGFFLACPHSSHAKSAALRHQAHRHIRSAVPNPFLTRIPARAEIACTDSTRRRLTGAFVRP